MGLEITPLLAASALLSAGGAVANGMVQKKNADAQSRAQLAATQQEMERQREYQQQATAELNKTLGQFAPEQQAAKQQQETDTRTAGAEQAVKDSPAIATGTPLTGNQNSVIASDIARSMEDASKKGMQYAGNLGKLSAYSGMGLNDSLALAEGNRQLSPILANSRLTASLFPNRLKYAAGSAKQSSSVLGDLMGAAGTLGSYAAGRGKLF